MENTASNKDYSNQTNELYDMLQEIMSCPIPDDVFQRLKMICATQGITYREFIMNIAIELLEKLELERKTKNEGKEILL